MAAVVAVVLTVSVVSSAAYVSLPRQPEPSATSQPISVSTSPGSQTSVVDIASQTWTGTAQGQGASSHPGSPSGAIGIAQAVRMMKALPAYAQVNATSDTVTFDAQSPNVVILAAMPDDAANITGRQPPPYATADVFVIGGLIDPTLVFQRGATVNFTFVNVDDDMYHNFVLTTLPPPYGYMMMAGGGMGPGMASDFLSTMPVLAPANYQQGYAYAYSYGLTMSVSGHYWYACTYPGHAQSGMYGEVITG